ncbi:MAG: dppA [Firmicutes bacterium]|nr:dppA [Bacillota bacterium]
MQQGFRSVVAVALASTLLLAGCSSSRQQGQSGDQKTSRNPKAQQLVVLMPAGNSTLDPAINYEVAGQPILPAIYEALIQLKPDGKIAPQLATSWDVTPDGKTYTFHLRQGVKFHDGEPFNAQAMKGSIERMVAIGQGASYIFKDPVAKIDTPDENTLVFTLKKPVSHFLLSLTSPWAGGAISPKAIKENETKDSKGNPDQAQEWLKTHAVGTGPYKVKDSVASDSTTLERNPDWWGWAEVNNPSPIEKILVKSVAEASTQRLMLEKGEADITFGIKVTDAADLKKNSDIVTQPVATGLARILSFNNAKPPLNDRRVRQALSYSFPYAEALASYGDGAKRIIGQMPEGMFGYDAKLPVYNTDLEKARQLLSEAGVNGLKLDYLWVTGEDDGRKVAELWQANLKKLGVDLNIKEGSYSTFKEQMNSPKTMPDVAAHYWGPDYPDFSAIVNLLYDGRLQQPTGTNLSFYQNKQVDELLDKIGMETDDKQRAALASQAQALILQDAPDIWVAYVPQLIASRKEVQGYVRHPFFDWRVNYAEIHK